VAGYALLRSGKAQDAIDILKVNVHAYPESWNAYDSLGEAYAVAGQKDLAIQNYQKSLELNPKTIMRARRSQS
jgi:tetratricopeptide (TPR) repeat protein